MHPGSRAGLCLGEGKRALPTDCKERGGQGQRARGWFLWIRGGGIPVLGKTLSDRAELGFFNELGDGFPQAGRRIWMGLAAGVRSRKTYSAAQAAKKCFVFE